MFAALQAWRDRRRRKLDERDRAFATASPEERRLMETPVEDLQANRFAHEHLGADPEILRPDDLPRD